MGGKGGGVEVEGDFDEDGEAEDGQGDGGHVCFWMLCVCVSG